MGRKKTVNEISFQCTLFEIIKKYIFLSNVVKNSRHKPERLVTFSLIICCEIRPKCLIVACDIQKCMFSKVHAIEPSQFALYMHTKSMLYRQFILVNW